MDARFDRGRSDDCAAVTGTGTGHGAAAHLWSDEGCDCRSQWGKHLQNDKFDVAQRKVDDVTTMQRQLGMPEKYAGCQVARVGRYVIHGHVPALDILRLLREQPRAIGLAGPDMPVGSQAWSAPERKTRTRCC